MSQRSFEYQEIEQDDLRFWKCWKYSACFKACTQNCQHKIFLFFKYFILFPLDVFKCKGNCEGEGVGCKISPCPTSEWGVACEPESMVCLQVITARCIAYTIDVLVAYNQSRAKVTWVGRCPPVPPPCCDGVSATQSASWHHGDVHILEKHPAYLCSFNVVIMPSTYCSQRFGVG